MADKITFLGTGGDSLVVGKQMRTSGGIVLDIENNQFVLDPGPGCLIMAKTAGINIRDTIAILVTTNKLIHSNDLNAVIDGLTVSGLDVMGVVLGAKKALEGGQSEQPVLNPKYAAFVERALVLEPEKKLSINNVNIYTTKTSSSGEDSIGFIFETQKYRLGYTSDTEFTDEIAEQYKGCDLIILNCKNPSGVKEAGSMNSDDAVSFIRKAKPEKAILTHFGIKMLQADPVQEARRIQRETKVDVIVATDCMALTPSAFSSKMKQANLDEFKR